MNILILIYIIELGSEVCFLQWKVDYILGRAGLVYVSECYISAVEHENRCSPRSVSVVMTWGRKLHLSPLPPLPPSGLQLLSDSAGGGTVGEISSVHWATATHTEYYQSQSVLVRLTRTLNIKNTVLVSDLKPKLDKMNNNTGSTLELDREVYIKMEAEEDLACSAETMWVRKQNTCLSPAVRSLLPRLFYFIVFI